MNFKKGDIVEFIGTKQYTSPSGKVFFTIKPGEAKITAIMTNEKSIHPYHLVATSNSKSTVDGWVDEKDIKELKKKVEIKAVSFANSKKVRLGMTKDTTEGMEIYSENWKDSEWVMVFRAKDSELAEKLAHNAELGCAKKTFSGVHSNPTMIVDICLEAAGISIPMINKTSLIKSGLFTCFTSEYYRKSSTYLRRGDIILSNGNSAIVLTNGKESTKLMPMSDPKPEEEKPAITAPVVGKVEQESVEKKVVTADDEPEERDSELAGIYETITPTQVKTAPDVRNGAFIILPVGINVENFGYYTLYNDVKYLIIQTEYKNTTYNGFVSEKCLIKK